MKTVCFTKKFKNIDLFYQHGLINSLEYIIIYMYSKINRQNVNLRLLCNGLPYNVEKQGEKTWICA